MCVKVAFLLAASIGLANASAQSFEENFSTAVSNYQSSQYEAASKLFETELENHPENAALLYNFGLTEYRLGRLGKAIGLWRKALSLKPSFAAAKDALSFATSKLEHKELPHQATFAESVRTGILLWISIHHALFLLSVSLFFLGWFGVKYLRERKNSLANEEPPPNPSLALIGYLAIFTFSVGLTGLKWMDTATVRATVLPKALSARTGPDEGHAELFQLYEGLEVIVSERKNTWLKATYPGGASGWIPEDAVLITWGEWQL